jgi:putative two-component system response regulator
MEVESLCESFGPDLICLDLHMPRLDGFEVLQRLARRIQADSFLPILMLTSDSSLQSRRRALALGATDFVTKPFDPDEVALRIQNLLLPRFLHLELAAHNAGLESQVQERTRALEESRLEVLERLALAAEFRDDATGRHAARVGFTAGKLAALVGASPSEAEVIARAAPLHDLGKIGVPDHILLKPGKLSPDEFEVMKRHPGIGARLLAGGRTHLMRIAEEIAHHHHERWDGLGYPAGLKDSAIPFAARVVAVADVFDALTHERPYRPAWPLPSALAELRRLAGSSFDPALIDGFMRLSHQELL